MGETTKTFFFSFAVRFLSLRWLTIKMIAKHLRCVCMCASPTHTNAWLNNLKATLLNDKMMDEGLNRSHEPTTKNNNDITVWRADGGAENGKINVAPPPSAQFFSSWARKLICNRLRQYQVVINVIT
jgi:hypothetical protein